MRTRPAPPSTDPCVPPRPVRLHRTRTRSRLRLAIATLLSGTAACGNPSDPPPLESGLALEEVARGLEAPVFLTGLAGDPRLFVVEQPGRVRIVRDGQLEPGAFLDIAARVGSGGERGLLSIAFAPDYSTSGHVFVYYTNTAGDTRVARFERAADPDRLDPASERVYLQLDQPFSNHNGGQLAFGRDGYLYIGLGDGGSGGDPLNSGQDTSTLLGSILRIDVSSPPPYHIPPDNPLVGEAGARPEIWAWGLRNPWRFSFDAPSSTLYIGDVGQNQWEEIDARPVSEGGLNYGWRIREGLECFAAAGCATQDLVDPVVVYSHSEGCSVTGGYVYRGARIPSLQGRYLYGDYCGGWIRSFLLSGGVATEQRQLDLPEVPNLSSFGIDAAGEVYALSLSGLVYRIAPAP